jgi:tetratricopeptide (TPR) repeat protein
MNEVVNKRAFSLVLLRPAILLLSVGIACIVSAGGIEQQICDVGADYSLGLEDYPEAIRLHNEVVRKHPDNALAHYHLGFAQGMIGNRTAEVSEYQRAAALGLRNWDLYLNLGLAELEDGDLDAAIDSLRQAVLRGPNHPESHFNLALVYERRGLLADAEREMLASLNLDPGQPDARYAEERKTERASLVWRELVHDVPDHEPARENLRLLSNQLEVARGETAAVVLPRRPPSNPLSPPDGRSAPTWPDQNCKRILPDSHESRRDESKPTRNHSRRR